MRFLKLQLSAMEKLVSCPDSQYDLIIDENRIDKACEQLANFLEIYWRATHPIDEKSDSNKNWMNKSSRIFHSKNAQQII